MRLYELGVPYIDPDTDEAKTEFGYALTSGRLDPRQAGAFWTAFCERYKDWDMFLDLAREVRYLNNGQQESMRAFVHDGGSIDSEEQLSLLHETLMLGDMTDFPVAFPEPAAWHSPALLARDQPIGQPQPSRARPRMHYPTKALA